MKKLRLLSISLFAVMLVVVLLSACTAYDMKDMKSSSAQTVVTTIASGNNQPSSGSERIAATSACNAYTIALEDVTPVEGNWEWVWTVTNNNPGSGNGGTIQDLSHWGMTFGSCFVWSSVVGAAYSADGVTWTSFTPSYSVDPSQTCMTNPVLKFDYGTIGAAPSYYKLILNAEYQPGAAPGYYKSGNRTGCCIFNFVGVGCPGSPGER